MFQTKLGAISDPVERYFAIARERQSIFLKKEAGLPRPWTDDAIFNHFKFTNVFREQDKTTKWFRTNVREPLRNKPEVLLATVLFRWFNRIEIGETIFNKTIAAQSAWDVFLRTGRADFLERSIRFYHEKGPWVTGAYLITSKPNMDKLAGMCSIVEDFYHGKFSNISIMKTYGIEGGKPNDLSWKTIADNCLLGNLSLQEVWKWLKGVPFQGPFHAYEVVSDLRHTALLDHAPDINTWANAGPGAQRGLARLHGRPLNSRVPAAQAVAEMRALLGFSKDTKYWPNNRDYPAWELREVEHQLCENDKYHRVYESNGKKKPRSIYR